MQCEKNVVSRLELELLERTTCLGNAINEDEMGVICNTNGGDEKCVYIFKREP